VAETVPAPTRVYEDRIVGLISLPIDVLPAILQVLIAERFKFIAANSNKAVPASMASVSR
jgi:hypothetical protein